MSDPDPTPSAHPAPFVPDITTDHDRLAAALAYAAAGLYVLPLQAGTKKPAAELGRQWQTKSSVDAEQIVAWFAGTGYGIGLHVGRSGVVAFDVDYPDRLPDPLRQAITETTPPQQRTRTGDPDRGHYLFQYRHGRILGNGVGRLGGAWGEIRGRGGQIAAAPTPHEKATEGGCYAWARTGPIPPLPACVDDLLHDPGPGEADAATDAEVITFLNQHTQATRPQLLQVWLTLFWRKVEAGESRHQRMISIAAGALAEARAGYFPARQAMDRLQDAFLTAVAQDPRPGGQQRPARTGALAVSEWKGISAWAVAQANTADLGQVHARVRAEVPDADDLSWIPTQATAQALDAAGFHPSHAEPATPDTGSSSNTDSTSNTGGTSGTGRSSGTGAPDRDRAARPEQPGLATTPSMFFDKHDGLLALRLAKAVLAMGPVATDDTGDLYRFSQGVWRGDGERVVRDRVTELLADLRRVTHASNVVDMLRSRDPAFADIGADTRFLNLPNGLLDWRRQQLRPHDPAVPSAIRIPVTWDPTATCPAIQEWFSEVFPADALPFVEEVIGYCLYNGNPLHKALLLYGRGRNGKGTFLRLLKALLGADNVSSVTPQALDENRFRAAELHGKLANLVGDVDPRVFRVTETFKQITGGDMLTAERKYGQPFRFTARAVMVAAFNKLPRTTDTTEGFFSRWIVVPFTGHFPPGIANPHRETTLHTDRELQGLLVLAVRGLARLLDRGHFDLPASVDQATAGFRRSADQVRGFLDDYLPGLLAEWVPRTEVYRAYEQWGTASGHRSMTAASFYERLETAGSDNATHVISPRKRNGTRGYLFKPRTPTTQTPTIENPGVENPGVGTAGVPDSRAGGADALPLQRIHGGKGGQPAPGALAGGPAATEPCARCLTATDSTILAETGGFCWTCWPGGTP